MRPPCHIGLAFSSRRDRCRERHGVAGHNRLRSGRHARRYRPRSGGRAQPRAGRRSADHRCRSPKRVQHLVGLGARALIERGLALSGGGEGEWPARCRCSSIIMPRTSPTGRGRIRVPRRRSTRWRREGCRLAICTNKPVALSRALIAALGWSGRFAANLGGDSLARAQARSRRTLLATIAAAGAIRRRASSSATPRSTSPPRAPPACR